MLEYRLFFLGFLVQMISSSRSDRDKQALKQNEKTKNDADV